MQNTVRTLDFLPEIFRTPVNSQFLQSTMDQLIAQRNLTSSEGYIGTKFGYGVNLRDDYVSELTDIRTNYQLDPALIMLNDTNKVKDFFTYPEFIDALKNKGAETSNHNSLFQGNYHTADLFVDLDKLLNFHQYYWLPDGPELVDIIAKDSYFINITQDILGKKTFTSQSGVKLSSGMKIRFFGNITPAESIGVIYYVEGVGKEIKLIKEQDLRVAEEFTIPEYVPFDSKEYDSTGYDALFTGTLAIPEFITINRASQDRNLWSRTNKWVHADVISAIATYNNSPKLTGIKATRPIIEYYADLKLYNSGTIGTDYVDFIDYTTTNADSILGQSVVILPNSGFELFNGSRIIFANDPLRFDKVVTIDLIQSSSITFGTTQQLVNGDMFPVVRGADKNTSFIFNGTGYTRAQSKAYLNQFPRFDLFDKTGVSLGDTTKYPQSSFNGSLLFRYTPGTVNDSVLGFPITYISAGSLGDISFDWAYNDETFTFLKDNALDKQNVNIGRVHKLTSRTTHNVLNGWVNAKDASVQHQIFEFENVKTNKITCDIPVSTKYNTQPVQVYANNARLENSKFSITSGVNTVITLNDMVLPIEKITVMILSDSVSSTAYYEVPGNLANNALNQSVVTLSLGNIRNHFQTITKSSADLVGDSFGANNYRDLGNPIEFGSRIVRHENSMVLPMLMLHNSATNFFDALQFSSNEYLKYKIELLYLVENNEYSSIDFASYVLDDVITQRNEPSTNNQPFYWSDMLPHGVPDKMRTYKTQGATSFELSKIYKLDTASYEGVLVYLVRTENGNDVETQLLLNRDYTLNVHRPEVNILIDLLPTDTIITKEFNQTSGSFIPTTPTKMGFYPSFTPKIIEDTSYVNPVNMLQGHDGSLTALYGEYVDGKLTDIRDRVMLEFEQRIYNNIKTKFSYGELLDEVTPGYFRTSISPNEQPINTANFLSWIGTNRVDYRGQYYVIDDPKTWNYRDTTIKLGNTVNNIGHWKGLYLHFYDTIRPHIAPWEMLGFTDEPTWWESKYGVAPYRSTSPMWADLEKGLNWNDGNQFVIPTRVRPGLSDILPVDTDGNLLYPVDSIISSYDDMNFAKSWTAGDGSPAEYSYLKSSNYPFDLLKTLSVSKPVKFFNWFANLDQFNIDPTTNQRLMNSGPLDITKIELYGEGTPAHSYFNWIIDYNRKFGNDGISTVKARLNQVDVRLAYRVAGFTDADMMKFYLDHKSPTGSNSTLLIPEESISIVLHQNEPESRIDFSSLIVQKTNEGFKVWGNSQSKTYFVVQKPIIDGEYAKISFDVVQVSVPTRFSEYTDVVPYGTEFKTLSQLSSFIRSYGKYLENSGIRYETVVNGIDITWDQMIVEMLAWSTIGWGTGSVIGLNPAAAKLIIEKENLIVSPLTIADKNFVLNQNLYPITIADMFINRESTKLTLEPKFVDDTIAYLTADLYSIEHGVVFDNYTIFGDLIFDTTKGIRQSRILVTGTKTADWHGSVNASGFILNQENIEEWKPDTRYAKGTIISHKSSYWTASKPMIDQLIFDEESWTKIDYQQISKGLLPNPSTRSFESTLYYDSSRPSTIGDGDTLSHSLIGYRPRNYLESANLSELSQFNVYKTMLKVKGTHSGAKLFDNKDLLQGTSNYSLYENWAIRNSDFGGVMSRNFVDVALDSTKLLGNPSIVKFTTGYNLADAHQTVPMYSLANYGAVLNSSDFLPKISKTLEPGMPTAGYVNANDIDVFCYNFNRLNFTATNRNGVPTSINSLYKNQYIWLADHKGSWQVFTPVELMDSVENVERENVTGVSLTGCVNNLNDTVTLVFSEAHNLVKSNLIAVLQFDELVDGYYEVLGVPREDMVVIELTLPGRVAVIEKTGLVALLQARRVTEEEAVTDLSSRGSEFIQSKTWVDQGKFGSWETYVNNIAYKTTATTDQGTSQRHDSLAAISDDGFVSSDVSTGKVTWYSTTNSSLTVIDSIDDSAGFGTSMASAGDLLVISKPTGLLANTRYVDIYRMSRSLGSVAMYLNQRIACPDGIQEWGKTVAISSDGVWIFVSTGTNSVYVYSKDDFVLTPNSGYVSKGYTQLTREVKVVSDVRNAFEPGRSIRLPYSENEEDFPEFDTYDVTNSFYDPATNITSIILDRVLDNPLRDNSSIEYSITNYNLSTILQLPSSISSVDLAINTNHDASIVAIGSKKSSASGEISAGKVVVFSRLTENIEIQYTRSNNPYPIFTVTSNPDKFTKVTLNDRPLLRDIDYFRTGTSIILANGVTAGDILSVATNEFSITQTLISDLPEDIRGLMLTEFGSSVAISSTGLELLVGAPYDRTVQNREGAVYRFTDQGRLTGILRGTTDFIPSASAYTIYINGYPVIIPAGPIQQVVEAINVSPLTNIGAYAEDNKLVIHVIDQVITKANNKLVVTSLNSSALSNLGIVNYVKTQIITADTSALRSGFGSKISMNRFNSICISAPAGLSKVLTTFDFTDDGNWVDDTVYDNNFTQFIDEKKNHGVVYVYDLISGKGDNILNSGKYVFSQYVNDPTIDTAVNANYGGAIVFTDNEILVAQTGQGVAENSKLVVFRSPLNSPNWTLIRKPIDPVDLEKINGVQIYDSSNNSVLDQLDYFNPGQGKLLGVCHANLDHIYSVDPAVYTTDQGVAWADDHVGELWLDTSSLKFMNTAQNDINYNSMYWGKLFPGSSPQVFTWVESDEGPNDYTGPGTPYSLQKASGVQKVDSSGVIVTKFYFWVNGVNTISNGKTLSDLVVENYISNPEEAGIPYISLIGEGCIGLHNIRGALNGFSTLRIGFNDGKRSDAAHEEYLLIQEGNGDSFLSGVPKQARPDVLPEGLYKKLIHSLVGFDDLGREVPDPMLPESKRLGTGYRPNQSMFTNRNQALKNYILFINKWLMTIPYVEIGTWSFLRLRGQGFDLTKYWTFADWFDSNFDSSKKSKLDVKNINDLAKISAKEGTIVTVSPLNKAKETYQYKDSDWHRVGLSNGTIQFNSSVWDTTVDQHGFDTQLFDSAGLDSINSTELTFVIRAINEELTKEYPIQRNKALVILFNYALSESATRDYNTNWLSKTSFIDATHTVRSLEATPRYTEQSQDFVYDFLEEIKPYHVVIKDYLQKFTKDETLSMTATDFDLPSKYSTELQEYMSPELSFSSPDNIMQFSTSSEIWKDPEYANWFSVYGMSVDEVGELRFGGVLVSYIDNKTAKVKLSNINGMPNTGTIVVEGEKFGYEIDEETKLVTLNERSGEQKLHIPGTKYYVNIPGAFVSDPSTGYIFAPTIKVVLDQAYPAPREEIKLRATISSGSVVKVEVEQYGSGYLGTPTVFVEPSTNKSLSPSDIFATHLKWNNHGLITGSSIRIVKNASDYSNKFYYVRALTNSTIAVYEHLATAQADTERVKVSELLAGASAPAMHIAAKIELKMSPKPVRTFKIKSKYDRTTYGSKVTPWQRNKFYSGDVDRAAFAGLASESDKLAKATVFSNLSAISTGTGIGAKFTVAIPEFGMTYNQGTGRITTSLTSTQVIGAGTNFSTMLVGQELVVANGMNLGIVKSIESNTQLTLVANASFAVTNEQFIVAQADYNVVIEDAGSGYAQGDVLTIPGTLLNSGTSLNNLVMKVDAVSASGVIYTVNVSGVPNVDFSKIQKASSAKTVEALITILQIGSSENVRLSLNYNETLLEPGHLVGKHLQVTTAPKYYRKVIAAPFRVDVTGTGATFDVMTPVYKPESTRPHYFLKSVSKGTGYKKYDVLTIDGSLVGGVSGENDIYITVTNEGAFGEILNFYVVGKSNTSIKQYYVNPINNTDIELFIDHTMKNPVKTSEFEFSIGDKIYVPYPLVIDRSIVKVNGYLYACVKSNNDAEFDFTKWVQLKPDDDSLNAIDRTIAFGDSKAATMTGIDFDYIDVQPRPDSGTIIVSEDHTFDDIYIWQNYELAQPDNLTEKKVYYSTQTSAAIESAWDFVVTSGSTVHFSDSEPFIEDLSVFFNGMKFPYTKLMDTAFSADEALMSMIDAPYESTAAEPSVTDTEYSYGYGPDELVPGLMLDSVSITIRSLPLVESSVDASELTDSKTIILDSPVSGIAEIDIESLPAIVETTTPHLLEDNDLVLLGGALGSVQLNSNLFLVRVIDANKVALYFPNLDEDALDYDPVEGDHVVDYIDNGVIFKSGLLSIADIMSIDNPEITVLVGSTEVDSTLFVDQVVIQQPYPVGTEIEITVNNSNVIKGESEYRIEIDNRNEMTIYRKSSDQLSKTTNLVTVDTDKIYVAEINKFVGKNVVLINAEKIFYNSVDIANSCITGLIRGVSTTGVIPVHPINSTIEVLAKFNIVPKSRYNLSWNTMIDPIMGDPLQSSDTLTANFLT